MNNKLKELSENRQMNLSEAFEFFETISEMQTDSSNLAIRGFGIYGVAKYFKRYTLTEALWKNLTPEDKKKKFTVF